MSGSRCEQCGREGTRDFKVLGGFWDQVPGDNEPFWVSFITVCASTSACRKRWPNRDTELEALERA